MNDQDYMKQALLLAEQGRGTVSPNPMVGAVIVKEGQIIGQGYHEKYGSLHAERSALASCQEDPSGAVMYITLEPCCHYGKQPPCTDAILSAGIRRVVIGSGDPNPLVAGKGIDILKTHGIEVTEHVLEEDCTRLNRIFFHYIRTGRPYVVMKYAMTMDGKIAAATGASRWITGETARAHVQEQRSFLSAIMIGSGTLLADDPLLTCRLEGKRSPVRIICDSRLRTPLSCRIVQTAKEVPTILATCCKDENRMAPYRDAGCQILTVTESDGHLDLNALMKMLGEKGIDSILLEGGQTLNWAALKSGIVQKVQAYIAPKLLGGETAKTPVGGDGFPSPDLGIHLRDSRILPLGEDFLIESEVENHVYRNR